MGYVGSSDGTTILSDFVMHTVGQNTTDQSKIYVSSYIVDRTHQLTQNVSMSFDLGVDVKVFSMEIRPTDDLFDVYVMYSETSNGKMVGKVLYANLLDDTVKPRLWSFMNEVQSWFNRPINLNLTQVQKNDDYYIYAGNTNFINSTQDLIDLDLDWTKEENKHYGFFEVYTDSDHCKNQDTLEEETYGPTFYSVFAGVIDKHELTVGQWEIFT